jgi:DHA1 family bicyclomycin/chloramphenicol resistance-like MFS transporter
MAMNRVWVLAAAIAVGQFANSMILPALPLLARDFAVPASRAGLVITAYFGGFALVGFIAGPLSDRFGRRPVLLGGLVLLAFSSLACALATSLAALLMLRFLEAAGAAGAPVLARAIVRDLWRDRDLARALGLLAMSMGVSPVLGPVLGGLVADSVGWRWIFGLVAGLAVLAAFVVYAGVAETLTSRAPGKPRETWRDMRMLLVRSRFRTGVLYGAACYLAFGALYTAAPFMLIARLGLTHFQFGAAFAFISLCLAVGSIVGPRLIRDASSVKVLDGAAGLAIVAGLVLFAIAASGAERIATVILSFALFGFAFGVALSVGTALTLDDADEAAGAASSLSGGLQVAAAAIGSAAVNFLPEGTMTLSVIVLSAGVAALLAVRRLNKAEVVGGRS